MAVLTLYPYQFVIENLFFMDRVKNVIMKNCDFIKFLYSDKDCVMNSIYFHVPLIITGQERSFHKTRLLYDTLNNINITYIRQIYMIEKTILDYFISNGKKPIYKISENMYNGNIHFTETEQLFTNNAKGKFIIKFSGIWENNTEYGITYKFIYCNFCDTPKQYDVVQEHMYLTRVAAQPQTQQSLLSLPPPPTPPQPQPRVFTSILRRQNS